MKINLSANERKYLQEVLSFTEAEKYQKISDKLEIKNNIYFINKAELLFFFKKYEQAENILNKI